MEIVEKKWRETLKLAREKFRISFDTENDEAIALREIVIDQNQWDHTKCKFLCEFRMAGGDWESPVAYFRCQLKDGYAAIPDKHGSKMFCFIPNKGEGNQHLVSSGNGYVAPDAGRKRDESLRPNEKDCWKSLKVYLKKLVDQEIEEVKRNTYSRKPSDEG
jgi:hypothetical protein